MKTAFLFPGQGAQTVGMGKDIYEKYKSARKIYDKAQEILRMDIKKICFEGPEEELMKTENTQIAILTTSLAILEVLKENNVEAQYAAGLSLGEYGALIYGGYLNFEDGINLIKKRGYYMSKLVPDGQYSMAAIMGLESSKIEEVCKNIRNTGKFVVPANYNYSGQISISGDSQAIDIAIEKLKEAGARKAIKLKTSGPFHTERLESAKNEYSNELEKVCFNQGNGVKVIKNLDGTVYKENDNFKDILSKHIVSPVRFDKAIKLMQEEKVERFIEIGPGKTLTGFIKKELGEANLINLNSLETLEEFLNNK